ncbi:hypothetical protein K502DRAFT_329260 [Neoconidiobolus thromboides FSU 785]|nr:hypothetical protein K502DRAFT_329260 [Neoconidiobolus thromboides FSU 785]
MDNISSEITSKKVRVKLKEKLMLINNEDKEVVLITANSTNIEKVVKKIDDLPIILPNSYFQEGETLQFYSIKEKHNILYGYSWDQDKGKFEGKKLSKVDKRLGFGICPYLDNIILFGGINKDNQVTSDIFVINKKDRSKVKKTNSNLKSAYHTTVCNDNEMIVLGGLDEKNQLRPLNQSYSLNLKSLYWTPTPISNSYLPPTSYYPELFLLNDTNTNYENYIMLDDDFIYDLNILDKKWNKREYPFLDGIPVSINNDILILDDNYNVIDEISFSVLKSEFISTNYFLISVFSILLLLLLLAFVWLGLKIFYYHREFNKNFKRIELLPLVNNDYNNNTVLTNNDDLDTNENADHNNSIISNIIGSETLPLTRQTIPTHNANNNNIENVDFDIMINRDNNNMANEIYYERSLIAEQSTSLTSIITKYFDSDLKHSTSL